MPTALIRRDDGPVLTIEEMRQQCRIDAGWSQEETAAEDKLLLRLERAAVRAGEGKLGGPLLAADYRLTLDAWPDLPWLTLPTAHAREVTAIQQLQGGHRQSWADFIALADGPRLQLKPRAGAWPATDAAPDAIQIDYRAGLAESGDAVPEDVRHWLLFRVGTYYEHREALLAGATLTELPTSFVDGLLAPYRLDEVAL
ncbi:hypothetical protein BUE93_09485 [Chromobacterium amazonense]|uniref:PhiE125 gp8 family phage protein n=1 Tax=Chromobacterium amazonense TaxID=1382803 RepID=A0A2S9X578_9NEIS|nr:hypothetical protein [Chromobacterium amazonense]PRP70882.1 hypothetical protein BUE93_09485 [Chromobacterium amazonense]